MRLRAARQDAELTIEQVAAALEVSSAKISRLETGQRRAQTRDVRDLAELYQLPDSARDELMALARGSREPGWWQRYEEVGPSAATYLGLETAATGLQWFESQRLPGVFQTPDYIRALLRGIGPAETWGAAFIEEQVAIRLKRQERLTATPPLSVHAVIDEASLRRKIGSPAVMAGQLDHLLELAKEPTVRIQVLPFEAGSTPGLNGPFTILTFAQAELSDLVHVEGNHGQFFLEESGTVNRYRHIFDVITRVALPSTDSLDILARIGTDWRSRVS
jgi:transcriptional regulator with XRE-family HTH domain